MARRKHQIVLELCPEAYDALQCLIAQAQRERCQAGHSSPCGCNVAAQSILWVLDTCGVWEDESENEDLD